MKIDLSLKLRSNTIVKLIALLILAVVAIGISLGLLTLANAQIGNNPAESSSFVRQSARQIAEEIKTFAIYSLGINIGVAGVATLVIVLRKLRTTD